MKFPILILFLSSLVFAETGVEVDFKVTGGKTITAATKNVKGKVILQNGEYVAQGIVVDLKTLSTKMDLRDDHMKNKYLEVGKYPEAILVSGKGKDGKGSGKIKIRGVEKDFSGTFKVVGDKEISANFDLNLPDFNIAGIRYMGIGVKDTVSLRVIVPLEKGVAVAPPVAPPAKKK